MPTICTKKQHIQQKKHIRSIIFSAFTSQTQQTMNLIGVLKIFYYFQTSNAYNYVLSAFTVRYQLISLRPKAT